MVKKSKSIMNQIFRQYFDKTSCTYTYFLGDLKSRIGIFIDTVQEFAKRDLRTIEEFKIDRVYLLSTHVHADHITGNAILKQELGPERARSVISKYYGDARADQLVGDGNQLELGCYKLKFLHTPGHTSGCLCILDDEQRRVFTGDTLLIRGCGRTDFQGGSSEKLYESVHKKLFTLPLDYTVYPAHDYNGMTATSIGEELEFNPRLTKSKPEFIEIMSNLNLAYPKLIDVAVPKNLRCGY